MRRLPDKVYYEIEALHAYNIDLLHRELFLVGEEHVELPEGGEEPGVEFAMASRLIKNIRYLSNQESTAPITLHMKTCGGDWSEGMAIYHAIRTCPVPVHALVHTHARSMSSLILQAADWRVMMPDSCFMFHLGSYSDEGGWREVHSTMRFYEKTSDRMVEIYANAIRATPRARFMKQRWSKAKIKNWLHREMEKKDSVYLTAEETVELGFADAIFDGDWEALKSKS